MKIITIIIILAIFSPVACAVDTHNGILWKQVIKLGNSSPCYVPANQDYQSRLSQIGYDALEDDRLTQQTKKKPSSKGCVTFPYLGDPYDKDGSYKVNNWVHAGVDLRANTGDNVYALDGGTVVWKNLCLATKATFKTIDPLCKAPSSNGLQRSTLVLEDFAKTRKTFYLHMSEFSPDIVPGKKICKGQYLGKAGSVGTTASHLHVEVWPSTAPGYKNRVDALSGSNCSGKPPHKLANGKTITSYCELSDVQKYTIDPATLKPDIGWRELKLGERGNEIELRRVKNDAVAFFRGQPIKICEFGSNYLGHVNDALASSSVIVSPPSPTGKYLAVFCKATNDASSEVLIVDRSVMFAVKTITPSPLQLFQALSSWISFSKDDKYAVLNQTGDEGDYDPIALNLTTGVGKTFTAPLINEGTCPAEWVDNHTYRYQATSVCDGPEVPKEDRYNTICKSTGIYEYTLDIPTNEVLRKRIADWDSYRQ